MVASADLHKSMAFYILKPQASLGPISLPRVMSPQPDGPDLFVISSSSPPRAPCQTIKPSKMAPRPAPNICPATRPSQKATGAAAAFSQPSASDSSISSMPVCTSLKRRRENGASDPMGTYSQLYPCTSLT